MWPKQSHVCPIHFVALATPLAMTVRHQPVRGRGDDVSPYEGLVPTMGVNKNSLEFVNVLKLGG